MLIPRSATASTAISFLGDGLAAFSKRFLQQIILHAHLGIHPFQATVFGMATIAPKMELKTVLLRLDYGF